MTRWRTTDGAPKGKRPNIFNWTSFDDLLLYRDEQLELMEQGTITLALFRKRVRRWHQRYRELLEYRRWLDLEHPQQAAETPKGEQQL